MSPDDVLNAQFASSGMRPGYSMDSVDDYLDQVVLALRQGESLPRWEHAGIDTVRMQGYQFAQVDAFLTSLGVREADAAAATGPDGDDAVGRSSAAGSAATGQVSRPGPTVQPGSYDHSRPGLWRRLFGKR